MSRGFGIGRYGFGVDVMRGSNGCGVWRWNAMQGVRRGK